MKKIFYIIIAFTVLSCLNSKKNLPNNFDLGKTENGLYKNYYFDLEVPFNPNWFIQDKQQMNDLTKKSEELIAGEDENLKAAIKAAEVNVAYLLTLFKYEMESAVAFNPSFMVMAENITKAPEVKNGKDYLLITEKLLKETQLEYYFEKGAYEKNIGKNTFHVLEAKLDYLGQTITQDYICIVTKGFSLSFIVSYTTEEDKKELYEMINKIKM